MKRAEGVHTVPATTGSGWWNTVDGRVVLRHRLKEMAVEAGDEIARTLDVGHAIHGEDGAVTEKRLYGGDPCPPNDGQ